MLDPTLAALIRERLPGKRFGVFFSSSEGYFFPNGAEAASGHVVAEDGRHYFYWTDWIDERVGFELWDSFDPDEDTFDWFASPEYQDARREAGLG